ncbi:hypothetical protein KUTeg_016514 [Tegillarca granosa]|uniref:Uncharacterized protein n=1 Tax=Tegillarca granosa TaxID=220873 RepID=A0ABQ9EM12_TEGGR|nr:hypothetical protein KUTeg_016514 [Tegillarca granosa]
MVVTWTTDNVKKINEKLHGEKLIYFLHFTYYVLTTMVASAYLDSLIFKILIKKISNLYIIKHLLIRILTCTYSTCIIEKWLFLKQNANSVQLYWDHPVLTENKT